MHTTYKLVEYSVISGNLMNICILGLFLPEMAVLAKSVAKIMAVAQITKADATSALSVVVTASY